MHAVWAERFDTPWALKSIELHRLLQVLGAFGVAVLKSTFVYVVLHFRL
jgi:hypothetical protein